MDCYNCGFSGHISAMCPNVMCRHCAKVGHNSAQCPVKKCQCCKQLGHSVRDCPVDKMAKTCVVCGLRQHNSAECIVLKEWVVKRMMDELSKACSDVDFEKQKFCRIKDNLMLRLTTDTSTCFICFVEGHKKKECVDAPELKAEFEQLRMEIGKRQRVTTPANNTFWVSATTKRKTPYIWPGYIAAYKLWNTVEDDDGQQKRMYNTNWSSAEEEWLASAEGQRYLLLRNGIFHAPMDEEEIQPKSNCVSLLSAEAFALAGTELQKILSLPSASRRAL